MKKKIIGFLVVMCFFSVVTAFAVMPPQVYIKKIQLSQIKALAVVKEVVVEAEEEHYIDKKVEFELLESYGEDTPAKTFYGICRSSTGTPWVGGDIYFYPQAGETVFVTLLMSADSDSKDSCGIITSYTVASEELIKVLAGYGLDGIEYGMSSVYIKE